MQWNFCKAIAFICKRYCTFSNESVGFGICHSFFTKKKKNQCPWTHQLRLKRGLKTIFERLFLHNDFSQSYRSKLIFTNTYKSKYNPLRYNRTSPSRSDSFVTTQDAIMSEWVKSNVNIQIHCIHNIPHNEENSCTRSNNLVD